MSLRLPVSTEPDELIKELRVQRDWLTEINNLALLIHKLNSLKRVTSTRELANLIRRSKSWVGVSILLIRGLKVYPEIGKCSSRNQAYIFLQKKNKLRRFLE